VSELLQRENVIVDVENDVVVFRVSNLVARFSYQTAFQIAQRLRLAAGVAARIAGVSQEDRGDMKRQDAPESFFADVRLDDAGLNGGIRWNVWNDGELVAFQFGDQIARWEAPAAMTIASWFRQRGREGKAWAGDTSRTLSVAGILTDANARQ
jgi:hypothetical protein